MNKQVLIFILFFPLFCFCYGGEIEPPSNFYTDEITRVIFPGAFNLRDDGAIKGTTKKRDDKRSFLEYQVNVDFPAEQLISFYQKKYKALGYEFKGGSKWNLTDNNSMTNVSPRPCVFEIHEVWGNKTKKREAVVIIRYLSAFPSSGNQVDCSDKPDNSIACVWIGSFIQGDLKKMAEAQERNVGGQSR